MTPCKDDLKSTAQNAHWGRRTLEHQLKMNTKLEHMLTSLLINHWCVKHSRWMEFMGGFNRGSHFYPKFKKKRYRCIFEVCERAIGHSTALLAKYSEYGWNQSWVHNMMCGGKKAQHSNIKTPSESCVPLSVLVSVSQRVFLLVGVLPSFCICGVCDMKRLWERTQNINHVTQSVK